MQALTEIASLLTRVKRPISQRERETANTVKSWVAEWEARNRLVKAAAFSLVRSLEKTVSATRRLPREADQRHWCGWER